LAENIGEKFVGSIYTISSILVILLFPIVIHSLSKLGNYKTSIITLLIYTLSVSALAFLTDKIFLTIAFMAIVVFGNLIYFNFDVFLESLSEDSETGNIRGKYLLAINIAWLISPIISTTIVEENNFSRMYLIVSLILIAITLTLITTLKSFKDPVYQTVKISDGFRQLWYNKNIFRVTVVAFLLRFFYAIMVIYTPLYLNAHLNLPWESIGLIFTIMLLPFVILDLPLGKIADRWIGEKEMMILGFLIMTISTFVISFITSTQIWLWAIILFATRIGACMIEISSESYFFKQIKAGDTNAVGIFRMTNPLAYTIAPFLATAFLSFFDIRFIFLALAIVVISGTIFSLKIIDTR
jgi:MFS family permease